MWRAAGLGSQCRRLLHFDPYNRRAVGSSREVFFHFFVTVLHLFCEVPGVQGCSKRRLFKVRSAFSPSSWRGLSVAPVAAVCGDGFLGQRSPSGTELLVLSAHFSFVKWHLRTLEKSGEKAPTICSCEPSKVGLSVKQKTLF